MMFDCVAREFPHLAQTPILFHASNRRSKDPAIHVPMKSLDYFLEKGEMRQHEVLFRILANSNIAQDENANGNSTSRSTGDDEPAYHEASQLNSLGLYFSVVQRDPRRALVCHMHALKILRAVVPPTEESLVEGAITRLDIAQVLGSLGHEDDAARLILEARAILAPLGTSAITQVLLSDNQQRQYPGETFRNDKDQQ